jgi:hypothetical protein
MLATSAILNVLMPVDRHVRAQIRKDLFSIEEKAWSHEKPGRFSVYFFMYFFGVVRRNPKTDRARSVSSIRVCGCAEHPQAVTDACARVVV